MKKILGLLALVLLLAVPVAGQDEELLCVTVPQELTYWDWGGDAPGPHAIRSYLYPGNEDEGRSGYDSYAPWRSQNPTEAYWLIGELDFLMCDPNVPDVPMAHIVYDTFAMRSCITSPIGCPLEDCDRVCTGQYPRPIGPISYYVDWDNEFQSYIDYAQMWESEDIVFEALVLQLSNGRAYHYSGNFDRDEDGNCEFSATHTLWVYKIDQLGGMKLHNPPRKVDGRSR